MINTKCSVSMTSVVYVSSAASTQGSHMDLQSPSNSTGTSVCCLVQYYPCHPQSPPSPSYECFFAILYTITAQFLILFAKLCVAHMNQIGFFIIISEFLHLLFTFKTPVRMGWMHFSGLNSYPFAYFVFSLYMYIFVPFDQLLFHIR